MLVLLNVRSRNKRVVDVHTEAFESSRIRGLRLNQNLESNPVLPGWAEFMYAFDEKRNELFTVEETVAQISSMSGGHGYPTLAGTAATGWTAVEFGDGVHNRTILTKDASIVQAVAGAALSFGSKAYDFPKGQIKCTYGTIGFTISAPTGTETPEVGLGTIVGSLDKTTLGAVGNAAEDVLDGTATAAVTTEGTVESYLFTAEAGVLDGTVTAKDLYFNVAGNWAATENLTIASITVDLSWEFWGALPA